MVRAHARPALLLAALLIAATPAAQTERTSTVADRESINVTVYNTGTALVHDKRRVALDAGSNRLAWRDVSAQMDATSALLESPHGSVSVLEQNFDYDLFNPEGVLQKYVGRDITVVHDDHTRERARVLSAGNGIVLQYADRIETSLRGYIAFPTSTQGFRDHPTLVLDVDSGSAGTQPLELSYMTNGMTWRADYVGSMNADGTRMGLVGLVTLQNSSGASYDNAHLQLMAGNVNVAARSEGNLVRPGTTADVYSVNAAAMPREETAFEYHLYTFPRTTTILDKQTKQLTLLSARDVPIVKTLELRGGDAYYRSADADLGDRLPVGVYVSFVNRGGELGIPLPAGTVRIYKKDSQGTSQFLGSDNIDHTPKNETVRLHLGDSFDVTARKKQTNFRFMGNCTTESSYEIVLGNAKTTPEAVLVVEPIPAQWDILQENRPHIKSSSSTATWSVPIAAGSHTKLTYRALVTWC